jgi:diacylglycerol kinase (ATP)
VRRALLVVNPTARGDSVAVAAQASEILRRSGIDVAVCETLARADVGVDWVVAVGGDGTAREVAQGLATSLGTWPSGGPAGPDAARLLILPAGTGNSVHKALWGDRTWQDTLDRALHGDAVRRDLDLLRIASHDHAVLLGASAGLLRWTLDATARFPELSGRELYATAGLAAAQELRPFAGRVTVDGRLLAEGPISLAATGGARRRGGSLLLFPHSRLDDSLLDVCVLVSRTSDEAIAQLLPAMEGRHLDAPGVHCARGSEVTLESLDGPLPFEHDGDAWPGEDTSITLRVVPAAVPTLAAADCEA